MGTIRTQNEAMSNDRSRQRIPASAAKRFTRFELRIQCLMADLHGAVGPQQYRQRRVEHEGHDCDCDTNGLRPRQLSTDPAIGFGWRRVHRTVQLLVTQGSSAVMLSNPRSY